MKTKKRFAIRKLGITWNIFDSRKKKYVISIDNKVATWNKFEVCRAVCDRLNAQ